MVQVTAVVQALRRSLPFGGGDYTESDADPREPASSHPAAPSDVFAELGLSPEDYLIQLCRSYGGRMKQQTVVEQTDWPASSVSRLLSDMEADGRIVRLPVGREKVVVLPDRPPESPDKTMVHA